MVHPFFLPLMKGEKNCHPEHREGSERTHYHILSLRAKRRVSRTPTNAFQIFRTESSTTRLPSASYAQNDKQKSPFEKGDFLLVKIVVVVSSSQRTKGDKKLPQLLRCDYVRSKRVFRVSGIQ